MQPRTKMNGPAGMARCRELRADLSILDLVPLGLHGLEERSRVRSALARLPGKQAVALVLRHSGLGYADEAAALDLSPASGAATVRRAESALPKELIRHASSD